MPPPLARLWSADTALYRPLLVPLIVAT